MPHKDDLATSPSKSNTNRKVDRRKLLAGLGSAGAASVAGCLSSFNAGSSGGGNTLKIGLSVPLSGEFSSLGTIYNTAFKAWKKNVNSKIGGKSVKVLTEDNQSTESRASKIASRFVSKDVDFVVNAYSSPLSRAMASPLEKAKIPLMTTGSLNYSIHQGFDYMFMFEPPLARKGAGDILKNHDVTKVAALAVDLGWARLSQKRFINKIAPKHNIDIVYKDVHARDTSDFDSYILKAKNNGADAVVATNYSHHVVNMVRSMQAKSFTPKYLDCQTATAATVGDKLGNVVKGMAAPTIYMKQFDTPGNKQFKKTFKKIRKSKEVSLDYHAALAYSSLQSFQKAVTDGGVTDGKKVRDYLMNNEIGTVAGKAAFNKNGVQSGIPWSLLQWRNSSDKKLIWPDDRATANTIFPKPW